MLKLCTKPTTKSNYKYNERLYVQLRPNTKTVYTAQMRFYSTKLSFGRIYLEYIYNLDNNK